jgi:hypothetical protein
MEVDEFDASVDAPPHNWRTEHQDREQADTIGRWIECEEMPA